MKLSHNHFTFILTSFVLIGLLLPTTSLSARSAPSNPNLDDFMKSPYYGQNDHHSLWVIFIAVGDSKRDTRNINALTEIFSAHGCPSDHLFYLIDDQATKTSILIEPKAWLDTQPVEESDTILFYFSMHGSQIDDQDPFDEPDNIDEYLVPYDYDFDEGVYLLDDELNQILSDIDHPNIALIFETCYSGGMIDGTADVTADGRVIITSAAADESSWPMYLPPSWVFPHYLAKGLSGKAEANADGWISAEEAFAYAEQPTIFRSSLLAFVYSLIPFIPHDFFPQHPQLYDGWPTRENNTADLPLFAL